ncbi:1-aminocyclopropane-1-carboxylate oxidase homolog 1-like isoform X2 [Humulus lupulus]|uniref:1-aminocyclopropane-1-carboxylate oxidase homolog 1-like isoform X2 n=1 Tax=Humulus lupulus TaxID=3486 RepID=UPI002B412999|nr:1-aminocyclopropane-1-carboxylate oxidase homolog 1-like isoform X2 [Humulus lupulus]
MHNTIEDHNRLEALKRFDESKAGVKGLVDAGITSIPSFFVHPSETLSDLKPTHHTPVQSIPVIDLSGFDSDRRGAIVDQMSRSARDFGFFQIINHGISPEILERTISAVKAFHELPAEAKAEFYGRPGGGEAGFSYSSNIDLYRSKAASWRDAISVRLGDFTEDRIPEICRGAVAEWDGEVVRLGEVLLELVGEGLGLCAGRFGDLSCLGARVMVGQYYPYCPQPDLTVGIASHADPGLLTLLLQNHIGGLQVKYGGVWLDVKPLPGAVLVNVGDLLQLSEKQHQNSQYKSHSVSQNPQYNNGNNFITVVFQSSLLEYIYI